MLDHVHCTEVNDISDKLKRLLLSFSSSNYMNVVDATSIVINPLVYTDQDQDQEQELESDDEIMSKSAKLKRLLLSFSSSNYMNVVDVPTIINPLVYTDQESELESDDEITSKSDKLKRLLLSFTSN
jgi:hypothetical protein